MGRYLQHGGPTGKIQALEQLGAIHIAKVPTTLAEIPDDKAVVCVVDNRAFQAAGYAYNDRELAAFVAPDGRPKTWLLMDKAFVEEHAK